VYLFTYNLIIIIIIIIIIIEKMASTAADSKGLDSQSKNRYYSVIPIAIETCYKGKVLSSDLMLYVDCQ
jgi:uncharacterized alpha/beta hydrolase family protein